MKTAKKILTYAVVATMVVSMLPVSTMAKKAPKLNKKKLTLTVGISYQLKLKNNKKKVKWSSSKKKVAIVSTKGKVRAMSAGSCKITAKVGKKKYTCKVTVKAGNDSTPGGNNGGNNSGTTEKVDYSKVTGTPGQNVDLGTSTAFELTTGRDTKKFALGLTSTEAKKILGTLSCDTFISSKTPQGFNVIAYRPDRNYNTYLMLYFKDDKIVSMAGFGKNLKFGNEIAVGTDGKTFEDTASGWKKESWFNAKGGSATQGAGAYSKTATSGEKMITFLDFFGDNKVIGFQIYDKAYTLDNMTKPEKTNVYSDVVNTAMETMVEDMLMVYVHNLGYQIHQKNAKLKQIAKDYAKQMCDSKKQNATFRSEDIIFGKMRDAGLAPSYWGEWNYAGANDAIGFFNQVIDSKESYEDYLLNPMYIHFGVGIENYAGSQMHYPHMVIDYLG